MAGGSALGMLMDASGGGMWMAAADVAKDLIGKAMFGEAGPEAPKQANMGMQDLGIGSSGSSAKAMEQTAQAAPLSQGLAGALGAISGPAAQTPAGAPMANPIDPQGAASVPPPPTATGTGFNQGSAVSPSVMDTFAATEPDDPKNTPHNRTLAEVAGAEPVMSEAAPTPTGSFLTAGEDISALAAEGKMTGNVMGMGTPVDTSTAKGGGKGLTGGMDPLEMAAIGASLVGGMMDSGPAPPPPGLPHMQGPGLVPMSRRRR